MDPGTTIVVIGVIAVLAILMWFFFARGKRPTAEDGAQGNDRGSGREADLGLREMLYDQQRLDEAMDAYRPQYNSLKELDPDSVLGVVVEMGMERGAATIAGFANGDARLFWTTGGGMIGQMQEYPRVAEAARSLVKTAQPLVAALPVETERPLPSPGRVRFALLTPGGMHGADEQQDDVERPDHPLFELYAAMQNLLTELRIVYEGTERR